MVASGIGFYCGYLPVRSMSGACYQYGVGFVDSRKAASHVGDADAQGSNRYAS